MLIHEASIDVSVCSLVQQAKPMGQLKLRNLNACVEEHRSAMVDHLDEAFPSNKQSVCRSRPHQNTAGAMEDEGWLPAGDPARPLSMACGTLGGGVAGRTRTDEVGMQMATKSGCF
jgi:hypothetical protein